MTGKEIITELKEIITELKKIIKECENEIKAEKNIKEREYLRGYTNGTRDACL